MFTRNAEINSGGMVGAAAVFARRPLFVCRT